MPSDAVQHTDALAAGASPVPALLFDWRPDRGPDGAAPDDLAALADELAGVTGGLVDVAVCSHPGGPPTCWCRPPLPGLPVAFARARGVDLARSVLVGASPAHRTLATALASAHSPLALR